MELSVIALPALHSQTANLVKALRQPTVRGRWGEIQREPPPPVVTAVGQASADAAGSAG